MRLMSCVAFVSGVVASCLPLIVSAQSICTVPPPCTLEGGVRCSMPKFVQVKVVNPKPVGPEKKKLSFGDSCSVDKGGAVIVVGSENDRILLRHVSDKKKSHTLACPAGTLFFGSISDLAAELKQQHVIDCQREAEEGLVRRLLEEEGRR